MAFLRGRPAHVVHNSLRAVSDINVHVHVSLALPEPVVLEYIKLHVRYHTGLVASSQSACNDINHVVSVTGGAGQRCYLQRVVQTVQLL